MDVATPLQQALADAGTAAPTPGLPAWFEARRRSALMAAATAPWPGRGAEAWKYTSLHALGQSTPRIPTASVGGGATAPARELGLEFEDGELRASSLEGLADGITLQSLGQALREDSQLLRFAFGREPEDGDVFDQLNAAFAVEGAWLRVAEGGGDDRWLSLPASATAAVDGGTWHLAHRMEIGPSARLRVDLSRQGDHAGMATVSTRIRVQRGGQLDLAWTGAPGDRLALIARTRIELEEGARLRLHLLDGGAAPSRHDLTILLRGEQAEAQLGGVFLLDARRHADVQLDLRHEAGHTRSETTWRAIADGRSRAVFDGRITVARGADGTDARLACKGLLATAQAEVDLKPVLEIHADDVKCAHGATVGQLDPQALFYLRTRGLAPLAARKLLTRAFATEALAGMDDSPALRRLIAHLDEAPA